MKPTKYNLLEEEGQKFNFENNYKARKDFLSLNMYLCMWYEIDYGRGMRS